jgi:hypothetical protein
MPWPDPKTPSGKALFSPLPPETILDDVLTPLNIVARGYRMVYDGQAAAYDRVKKCAAGVAPQGPDPGRQLAAPAPEAGAALTRGQPRSFPVPVPQDHPVAQPALLFLRPERRHRGRVHQVCHRPDWKTLGPASPGCEIIVHIAVDFFEKFSDRIDRIFRIGLGHIAFRMKAALRHPLAR